MFNMENLEICLLKKLIRSFRFYFIFSHILIQSSIRIYTTLKSSKDLKFYSRFFDSKNYLTIKYLKTILL